MGKFIICDTAEYDNNTTEFDTLDEAHAAYLTRIEEINPNWKGRVFIAEIKEVSIFP